MVQDQLIHIHRLKQIHSMEIKAAKSNELGSANDISPAPLSPVDIELSTSGSRRSPAMETSKTTETNLNNSNNNNDKKANRRTRRRLSWRNLLNPSYKSKSDSFYKIFCDTIPKTERLIADYSCALHREILIQGRLYISVNYVAFYSNLFSWVTKLVIHLRDVIEIRKTNTARFIPNAIQLVCSNGEKHVFASFVARDKSHSMISKLWRNNLSCELSNGDMRALVHMNYGKDLGMSDNEELSINSPDHARPEGNSDLVTPPAQRLGGMKRPKSYSLSGDTGHWKDCNNNGPGQGNIANSELDRLRNHWLSSPTLPLDRSLSNSSPSTRKLELNNTHQDTHDNRLSCSFSPERFRRRSLLDLGRRTGRVDQNEVINEVVVKLNELREFNRQQQADELSSLCNSSPVILGTPLSIRADSYSSSSAGPPPLHDESNERSTSSLQWRLESTGDTSSMLIEGSLVEKEEVESELASCTEKQEQVVGSCQLSPKPVPQDNQSQPQDEEPLEECCVCPEHKGKVLADQVFRMKVEELFHLLFVDPNFMQTYGETTGGISNYKAGSWLASDLAELSQPQPSASRTLNYSMSINHVWAKQVQVEEVQQICRLQWGRLYQLVTRSVNSGVPYSETFTVGLSYLLTATDDINRSRLLVQSMVNFDKDKASWRLNMVKPMIERQSSSGVQEFISGLTSCIEGHIGERLLGSSNAAKSKPLIVGSSSAPPTSTPVVEDGRVPWTPQRIQAKSRLKERKLRSMYRYYLRETNEASGGTLADSSSSTLSSLSLFEGSCIDGSLDVDESVEDRVSLLVNNERAGTDQVSLAPPEPGGSETPHWQPPSRGAYKDGLDVRRRPSRATTRLADEVPQAAAEAGLKSSQLVTLLIILLWGALFCSHMLIMGRLDALEARWATLEDIWLRQRQ